MEKCYLSDKEKCSYIENIQILKNEDIVFDVEPFYPINLDEDEGSTYNEYEIDVSFKVTGILGYIFNYFF